MYIYIYMLKQKEKLLLLTNCNNYTNSVLFLSHVTDILPFLSSFHVIYFLCSFHSTERTRYTCQWYVEYWTRPASTTPTATTSHTRFREEPRVSKRCPTLTSCLCLRRRMSGSHGTGTPWRTWRPRLSCGGSWSLWFTAMWLSGTLQSMARPLSLLSYRGGALLEQVLFVCYVEEVNRRKPKVLFVNMSRGRILSVILSVKLVEFVLQVKGEWQEDNEDQLALGRVWRGRRL